MTVTSVIHIKADDPFDVATALAVGANHLFTDSRLICFTDQDLKFAATLDNGVADVAMRWHPDSLHLRITQARRIVLLKPEEGAERRIIERHEETTRRCVIYIVE